MVILSLEVNLFWEETHDVVESPYEEVILSCRIKIKVFKHVIVRSMFWNLKAFFRTNGIIPPFAKR